MHLLSEILHQDELQSQIKKINLRIQQISRVNSIKLFQLNQKSTESMIWTSNSHQVINNISSNACPLLHFYLQVVKAQIKANSGDGLYVAYLAMILQLEFLRITHIEMKHISNGLSLALEWINYYLSHSACPLKIEASVANLADINSVARSVLFTHVKPWILTQELEHLMSLVVSTFIKQVSILDTKSHDRTQLDFIFQVSDDVCYSKVHHDTVFIEYRWCHEMSMKNEKILLLDINFYDSFVSGGTSSTGIPSPQTKYSKFVEIVVIMDVKVVMSKRSLPRGLQKALKVKGIAYFDQLSAKQANSIAKLSGAVILTDWDGHIIYPFLGQLTNLSTSTISEKQYIRLENNNGFSSKSNLRSWSAVSLTICAPDIHSFNEIVRAFQITMKTLQSLLVHSEVVAGGGCTEIHLAQWIRQKLSNETSKVNKVVKVIADALDQMVGFITGGIDEDAFRLLCLRNSATLGCPHSLHAEFSLFGWDLVTNNIVNVLKRDSEYSNNGKIILSYDPHILEPLQPKLNAIRAAIEITKLVLRCSTVLSDNSL